MERPAPSRILPASTVGRPAVGGPRCTPIAPWLTGVLGTGLVIWIGVQLLVMPEASFLQAIFGVIGLTLAATSVSWLRRTGQLRLW